MPQQLDWKVGDLYRTENGSVMEISGVREDRTLDCTDDQGMPHAFTGEGREMCAFQGYDCGHGGLVSRITGSVRG